MNTDTNLTIGIRAMHTQNNQLRERLTKTKKSIQITIDNLNKEMEKLNEALAVEHTPYVALFKKLEAGGFECVAVVDSRDLPEDTPEDFDMCLPLPKPETLTEFSGW